MTVPGSSQTLLTVIPDADALALTLEQATARNLSVVTAPDPKAALAMVEMARPEIVITDLFLPKPLGLVLIRDIHKRAPATATIASARTTDEG